MNVIHAIYGHSMPVSVPEDCEQIIFGMGCFWGAEKLFWPLNGVYSTAVGYAQGQAEQPSYDDVCSGRTGHNEVVLVIYRPEQITLEKLLVLFWENHNPTQGMRQGNDIGEQYRSGIYCKNELQLATANNSKSLYQKQLIANSFGEITTEIEILDCFYYAEEYHQQYLAKNPGGYCGMGGTGIRCN